MTFIAELSSGKKIVVSPRYLKLDQLGGVIFYCTDMTIEECLTKQLFGLPALHYGYVMNIRPGLPLFLFNYSTRQLHGIFEAASSGQMNINPYGWTKDDSERTPYPAQVQILVQKNCHPLLEKQFQPIITDNYYSSTQFRFELDQDQVRKLIALFSTQVVAPSALCDAYVDPTLHNEAEGKGPYSCLDRIHQPVGTSIEAMNQDGMNLICESLQKLPESGESSNSYPTGKVQGFESVNKMHDKVDGSQERKMAQVVNTKDGPLLPSDVLSIIAELQDLNAFKQESIETIGQLQQSQEKLLQELTAFKQKPIETIDQLQKSQQKLWQEFKASKQKPIEKIGQLQKSQQKLLQEFKPFKQESIKTTGQLQHSQQNLLSEVKQLHDRCTRLEALSRGEQHLDPDGLIYLVGGNDGMSWLGLIDSYSPSKDIIESRRTMPFIRAYTSVATLNGDLYVIGGGYDGSWHNTVETYKFNPANNDWKSLPCLHDFKGGLSATTLYGKIYAIGGGDGPRCFSDVEMFDIGFGRWIYSRSMWKKRLLLAAVELNGAIYAVGGYDGKEYLSSAERFDPREHYSWRRLRSMSSRRACHSLVVLNEKLYAIGGYDGCKMVASVEVFDPRRGSWMNEAPMNLSTGYMSAVVLSDSIYAIGGMGENMNVMEKVERYQEGVGWQLTNLKGVGKRCSASAIVM